MLEREPGAGRALQWHRGLFSLGARPARPEQAYADQNQSDGPDPPPGVTGQPPQVIEQEQDTGDDEDDGPEVASAHGSCLPGQCRARPGMAAEGPLFQTIRVYCY